MTKQDRYGIFGIIVVIAILNLVKGTSFSNYLNLPNLIIGIVVILSLIFTWIANANSNSFIYDNFNLIKDFAIAIIVITGFIAKFDIFSLIMIIIFVGLIGYDLYGYFRKSRKATN